MAYTPEQYEAVTATLGDALPQAQADQLDALVRGVLEAVEAVSPVVDVTSLMTRALETYSEAVEVAAGVKNKAVDLGFTEEVAQQMGQAAWLKIMGLAGAIESP